MLPQVCGTVASHLWLGLRGPHACQVTPSRTVYRLARHQLLSLVRLPLRCSSMQLGRARTSCLGVPPLLLACWVSWVAPLRRTLRVW